MCPQLGNACNAHSIPSFVRSFIRSPIVSAGAFRTLTGTHTPRNIGSRGAPWWGGADRPSSSRSFHTAFTAPITTITAAAAAIAGGDSAAAAPATTPPHGRILRSRSEERPEPSSSGCSPETAPSTDHARSPTLPSPQVSAQQPWRLSPFTATRLAVSDFDRPIGGSPRARMKGSGSAHSSFWRFGRTSAEEVVETQDHLRVASESDANTRHHMARQDFQRSFEEQHLQQQAVQRAAAARLSPPPHPSPLRQGSNQLRVSSTTPNGSVTTNSDGSYSGKGGGGSWTVLPPTTPNSAASGKTGPPSLTPNGSIGRPFVTPQGSLTGSLGGRPGSGPMGSPHSSFGGPFGHVATVVDHLQRLNAEGSGSGRGGGSGTGGGGSSSVGFACGRPPRDFGSVAARSTPHVSPCASVSEQRQGESESEGAQLRHIMNAGGCCCSGGGESASGGACRANPFLEHRQQEQQLAMRSTSSMVNPSGGSIRLIEVASASAGRSGPRNPFETSEEPPAQPSAGPPPNPFQSPAPMLKQEASLQRDTGPPKGKQGSVPFVAQSTSEPHPAALKQMSKGAAAGGSCASSIFGGGIGFVVQGCGVKQKGRPEDFPGAPACGSISLPLDQVKQQKLHFHTQQAQQQGRWRHQQAGKTASFAAAAPARDADGYTNMYGTFAEADVAHTRHSAEPLDREGLTTGEAGVKLRAWRSVDCDDVSTVRTCVDTS